MQQGFRDGNPPLIRDQEKEKMDLERTSAGDKETLVKEAEFARQKALAANDANLLGTLLAENLVFVHSSGTVDDRHSLLGKLENGRIRYQSVSLQPLKVLALGADTWALWGEMEANIVVANTERQVASSYVTVWVLQADGVLRLVLHQGTPLARA